jgi:IMP cyclohydrolase
VLSVLDYEKDQYNTPRIAGAVPLAGDTAWLAIVRHDALIVKAVALEAGQARYLATYEANDVAESQSSEFDASDAAAAARFAVDGGAFSGFEHPVTSAAALVEGSRFALATWIV